MSFALLRQLQKDGFLSDFQEQKELAITALLNTATPEQKIRVLERTLERYLDALGLKP